MTDSMQELQSELHFQLSLIRLMNMQNVTQPSARPEESRNPETAHLEDALTRIARAIQ